jgi:cytochrome b6-f complex iron-sulfur subunit
MESRRSFLSKVAMWMSLAASYGTAVAYALRALTPKRKLAAERSIYVGRLADMQDGGSRTVEDLRGTRVLLVREGEHVRALSTICPHLGCRVRWEGDKDRFFCPCHDGVFNREGGVVSGPPPRALDKYDVEVAAGAVYLRMKEPA